MNLVEALEVVNELANENILSDVEVEIEGVDCLLEIQQKQNEAIDIVASFINALKYNVEV